MAAPVDWRECLNEIELFEKLRNNKTKKRKQGDSTNIITTRGGEIYAWNHKQANVLTTNLKNLTSTSSAAVKNENRQNSTFQTFVCSEPPMFEVTSLQLSVTGQYLAAIGPRGISIILVPKKWGKYAEYEGGKSRITCRTHSVDQHLFASYGRVTVLQAVWHPGSATDSHLVVLTSDNIIRLYNVTDPVKPQKVISLSNRDNSFSLSLSKASITTALGASVVSFDFGQPVEQAKTAGSGDGENMDWPVYLLQGNGDVCMMNLNINDPRCQKPEVQGPLTMLPPADDNYGTDACSILCLQTLPPVLVIAESTGKLYHCVVLKSADDEGDARSEVSWTGSASQFGSNADCCLYVFEQVELELSLTRPTVDPGNIEQDEFTCPIRLHTDSTCKERYHCSHTAGVHTVALPWVQKMELFCDDESSDMYLNAVQGAEAIVEHVVCTKPLPNSQDSPITGLCIVSDHLLGNTLLCLTDEFECISLPLISSYRTPTPPLLSSSPSKRVESPLRKYHKEPFQEHVRKILQRSTSNPILRSRGDSTMTQHQCFQLLTRATQVFREEYIEKQNLAHEEIERRAAILSDVKEQQLSDLQDCQAARNQLTDKARELAERYEDCRDSHQQLEDRLHAVLSQLQRSMPVLSHAERNMQKELTDVQEKLDTFKKAIEQVKAKHEYQRKQISQHAGMSPGGSAISSAQSKRLRHVMKEEGDQISALVKQVKSLTVQVDEAA